jgi:hypothetical protein
MTFRTLAVSAAMAAALTASLYAQKPVLTEDFESGKIDPAVWDLRKQGAPTIGVEQVDGAHGKYALHIHYPDMERGAFAFIVATHLPDSVRTHYFGRAYMKITPTLATSHNPLIFTGEPGWPLSRFQEIGTSRANWMPSYQENKSLTAATGRGEVTWRSDVTPPYDKWFLLEWEFNDNPTSIRIWVDGEPVMNFMDKERKVPVDTVTFTWPKNDPDPKNSNLTGGYQEWGFGMRAWQNPTPAMDVYYDDIAISPTRIGPVK